MMIEAETVEIITKKFNQTFTSKNCYSVVVNSSIVEITYIDGKRRYIPLTNVYDIRVKKAKVDEKESIFFEINSKL